MERWSVGKWMGGMVGAWRSILEVCARTEAVTPAGIASAAFAN